MSDGFDKEAEREKLREKLADDDEKREHTQRMSELLLQGATMTNRHCDDCGDPIFRHDGREFCPTCHAGDPSDAGSSPAATPDSDAPPSESRDVEPADATTADAPDSPASTAADPQSTDPEPSGSDPAGQARSGPQTGRTANGTAASPPSAPEPTERSGAGGPADRSGRTASASVADARESLTATLARFAREAEATDDPRRAREHLRAAREAAETLSALE